MKYLEEIIVTAQQKDIYDYPNGDIEVTLGGETKITKDNVPVIFANVPSGRVFRNIFQKGWGAVEGTHRVDDNGQGCHTTYTGIYKRPYLEVSTDKTELKKGETCIIEAKASEDLQELIQGNQIAFNINSAERVISDYDYDNHTAVMTYVATGAGKVLITAHAQFDKEGSRTAYSNVLFLHDGVEK